MTIRIPQPSMALNSGYNPVGRAYKMWNTWEVSDDTPAEHVVDWVACVAGSAPDGYLRVVVINAHGNAAWMRLGTGFSRRNVGVFGRWHDKVANIWLIVCETAKVVPADLKRDGNLFCSAMAKASGAYVVASSNFQYPDHVSMPWGCVDAWEGRVVRYEPEHGSIDWHHDYGGPYSIDFAAAPPIAVPPGLRAKLHSHKPAGEGAR